MYLECSFRFSTFARMFCICLFSCPNKTQGTAFMRQQKPRKRHKSIQSKQVTKSKEYTFIGVVVTDVSQLTNCSVRFPRMCKAYFQANPIRFHRPNTSQSVTYKYTPTTKLQLLKPVGYTLANFTLTLLIKAIRRLRPFYRIPAYKRSLILN
jgi:hypothetical protein